MDASDLPNPAPVSRTESGEALPKRQREEQPPEVRVADRAAEPEQFLMRAMDLTVAHVKALVDVTHMRYLIEFGTCVRIASTPCRYARKYRP